MNITVNIEAIANSRDTWFGHISVYNTKEKISVASLMRVIFMFVFQCVIERVSLQRSYLL